MATDKKDNQGRPDLDLDFTFHASDQMRSVDVSKKETFEKRLNKSDKEFQADVNQARQDLVDLKERKVALALEKAIAEKAGKAEILKKKEQQIIHNNRMVASKTQELERVYYFGNKSKTLDAENKHDKNAKTRSDVSTDKIVGEETIGKNKKRASQIKGHVAEAKATGRKPLMYAPNMKKAGVRSAERKGMNVAQSQGEYHQKARAQYRVIKDDPARLKAAQDRNAAKKAELAAKAAKTTAKTHTTDKSKAARQEIKAKVNVLRGRKIFADLSGDRQKKIDAKKTNTEEVKQLRAAQHEKIWSRTKDQTVRQSEAQTERRADRKTVQERKVEKSHQSVNDRFKVVEQRAYDRAKARGADDAAAKKAGEDRVNHVKAKMELNAERQELKDKGQKLKEIEARAHIDKVSAFRDARQKDLAEQAKREDRSYQGPPSKDQGLKEVEARIQTRELTYRTRLEGSLRDGDMPSREYPGAKESLERQFAEFRQNDLARYYGQEHKNDHRQTQNQGYGSSYSSSHSMRR